MSSDASRPSTSRGSLLRRDAIVEATIDLLRDRSADKVAVADIAESAGVSVATVYNLIGSKDRVLVAVLDRYVGSLAARLRPDDDSSDPTVVDVIRLAIEAILADPAPFRAVMRELGPIDLDGHRGLGEFLSPLLDGVDFRDGHDADEVVRLIVYGFRGVLFSWAHGLVDDERFAIDGPLLAQHIVTAATVDG